MKEALLKKLKGELVEVERQLSWIESTLAVLDGGILLGPVSKSVLENAVRNRTIRVDHAQELRKYIQWLENL